MTINHFAKLYLCLIVFIFLSACKKDDDAIIIDELENIEACESLSDLGTFLLLDESKNFIPYESNNISKVIFADSTGQEFIGLITSNNTSINSANTVNSYPCPIDPHIDIEYSWQPESKGVIIEISELNIHIRLSVSVFLNPADYSQKLIYDNFLFVLSILDNTPGMTPNTQMSIPVNNRNNPAELNGSYTELSENFEILGETFQNVYIKEPNENEDFRLFYNNEIGIVGIQDIKNFTAHLKFVRVE